jgi:chromosomal replication initiator protein
MHFGGRDHSTVIHACQAVEDFLKTDLKRKQHIDQIRKTIELNR